MRFDSRLTVSGKPGAIQRGEISEGEEAWQADTI